MPSPLALNAGLSLRAAQDQIHTATVGVNDHF